MVQGTTRHWEVLGFIRQLLSSTPECSIPLVGEDIFSWCSANLSFLTAFLVSGYFTVFYPTGGRTEAQKA